MSVRKIVSQTGVVRDVGRGRDEAVDIRVGYRDDMGVDGIGLVRGVVELLEVWLEETELVLEAQEVLGVEDVVVLLEIKALLEVV